VKLSDGEKLILFMLAEIYKHLEIDGEVDPQLVQRALASGHYWGLKREYHGILDTEPPSDEVVSETEEILQMWTLLEESYDRLSPEDKKKVTEGSPFGDKVAFSGFDANNERHYGVASFLIKDLGMFSRFADRYLNSHWEMVEAYRRMLSAFKPALRTIGSSGLTTNQIIEILNQKTHPSHRS
jgi:uncharacterized protein